MTDRRVALVTGAAGGIGRATVTMLGEQGFAVAVVDLDAGVVEDVARQLGAAGVDAVGIACDIGDPASVAECLARVSSELGPVSVLHNNAAATTLARADPALLELTVEHWDETMRVNLRGTFLMTQAVLPGMLAAGSGSIINMSSMAALVGGGAQTAYSVTKAGIIALTRATATQYGKRGIRCNAIAPGLIQTPGNAGGHSGGRMREIMLRQHLTPRLGLPEDVAAAVCWLASDASAFVTGTVVPVDGGFTAHSAAAADVADLMRAES